MSDSTGLFSRAGRSNTQRFGAIKKMESMLSGHKSPPAPSIRPIPVLRKSTQELLLSLPSTRQESEEYSPPSVAFLAQSRGDFYASNSPKSAGPPPGAYNISYSQVDKHKGWADTRSSKACALFSPPESPSSHYFSTDLPRKKPSNALNFRTQISRSNHRIGLNSVHEKRFAGSNLMPSNASKYQKVTGIRFELRLPRSEKLFPGPAAAPDHYKPEKARIQSRSPNYSFSKATNVHSQLSLTNTSLYNVSYDPVSPRVKTVVDWGLEKPPKSELHLPRFMIATTSRLGIQEADTEKALRMRGTKIPV